MGKYEIPQRNVTAFHVKHFFQYVSYVGINKQQKKRHESTSAVAHDMQTYLHALFLTFFLSLFLKHLILNQNERKI